MNNSNKRKFKINNIINEEEEENEFQNVTKYLKENIEEIKIEIPKESLYYIRKNNPKIHIVSRFPLNKLNNNFIYHSIEENLKIKTEYVPTPIEIAEEGDIVLLYPGKYKAIEIGIYNINKSLEIIGIGKLNNDVIIYNNEDDDYFISIDKPITIRLNHLFLEQKGGDEGVINIIDGSIILEDCDIKIMNHGIIFDSEGYCVLSQCKLHDGSGTAIEIDRGNILIENCEFYNMGKGDKILKPSWGTITIDKSDKTKEPNIKLKDNIFHDNMGKNEQIIDHWEETTIQQYYF